MEIETKSEKKDIQDWLDRFYIENQNNEHSLNLVSVLQSVQEKFGYLPKTGMKKIAEKARLTPANVFSVATFYNQFRFSPPGKHDIKVCMGTACAIKQGQLILDQWERNLGIKVGQVTDDREYSLDRVDCVGCCTLAPVTIVNEEVIGEMQVTKVDGILLRHKIENERMQNTGSKEGAKK